ncbi:hypothetical protein FACS189494_11120 [Spirochaetia bacterium]|nr:hypothetical protein FACS189494_11120 [Spirochaetia bacterium]
MKALLTKVKNFVSYDENNAKGQSILYVLLFFIGIVVIILRSPAFATNILYAEDGTWLGQIYANGFWHALIHARSDYPVFCNIIMLKIADIVNYIAFGDNLSQSLFHTEPKYSNH